MKPSVVFFPGKLRKQAVSTIVSVVFSMTLILSGCGNEESAAPKEVVRPVKVITVAGNGGSVPMTFPGKTRANRRVDLSFKVPGPLVELPVEEGQIVKKGALIARILPRDFKLNLDQAKATAVNAQRQYERYKELYVRRQVSKADFDRYKANRDVAVVQLEDAKNALKDTYLRAPFEGVVAKRYVQNFQEVLAKEPIVFLQDNSRMEILVDAPETVVANLKQEQHFQAVATFAAVPGREFVLSLKEYSTEADPQTQTYQVVLVMDRPEGINILPGMTATVSGRKSAKKDTITRIVIPAIAVLENADGRSFVWELDMEKMRVAQKQILPGEMTGSSSIHVLEGLSGGEVIVISGVTKLREGMKVSIWNE